MTAPNIVIREFITYYGDTEYILVAVFDNEELYIRRVRPEHMYEMRNALTDFVKYGNFDVEDIKISRYRRMIGLEQQGYYILCVCYDDNNVLKAYASFDEILIHELRVALTDLVPYMNGGESDV